MEQRAIELFNKLSGDGFPPPDGPTVYAVCVRNYIHETGCEHVLYIGSSLKPNKRRGQDNHPYGKCINRFKDRLVYFKYYQTENYKEEELFLIKNYRPKLNKMGVCR